MLVPIVNVFIDGGGNECKGVQRYLRYFPPYHKVYVFEPNPQFHSSYEGYDFILVKKAMWTVDSVLPFYYGGGEILASSSLLKNKTDLNQTPPIDVECVDFSRWMRENIDPHWNVTLKLDIEGAEFDVLWKLIKDGTIKMVKKLYVEFHTRTVKGKEEEQKALVETLGSLGLSPGYWD